MKYHGNIANFCQSLGTLSQKRDTQKRRPI